MNTAPDDNSPEAFDHMISTGHYVDWNEECLLWACHDCSWLDSNFVGRTEL